MKALTLMAAAATLTIAMGTSAEAANVYMGITPIELTQIMGRAGWAPEKPVTLAQREIVFRPKAGGRSIRLTLLKCDGANRCASGFAQALTYLMVPNWHARQWNRQHHGAVSFNAMYHTLKRPLHFRGVTEVYLREVLTEVWPRAYQAYWREGRKAMKIRLRKK